MVIGLPPESLIAFSGILTLAMSTVSIRKFTAGTAKGLMAGLRNIFREAGDVTTVPEMLASYRAVKRKLPELRRNAGGKSLFEAAAFQDITVAALVESQKLLGRRARRHSAS
jgi:hypothetical protein